MEVHLLEGEKEEEPLWDEEVGEEKEIEGDEEREDEEEK